MLAFSVKNYQLQRFQQNSGSVLCEGLYMCCEAFGWMCRICVEYVEFVWNGSFHTNSTFYTAQTAKSFTIYNPSHHMDHLAYFWLQIGMSDIYNVHVQDSVIHDTNAQPVTHFLFCHRKCETGLSSYILSKLRTKPQFFLHYIAITFLSLHFV